MKKLCSLLFLLVLCAALVFAEGAPIKSGGWRWEEGENLNGKVFYDVAESYREQDGWAFIEGFGKIHYWLYDTYSYWNGDGQVLVDKCIPAWIESIGYVIDFDHIRKVDPNKDLASSVKALMKQRSCDVSVALITSETSYPYVVINNYNREKIIYSTDVIPLFAPSKPAGKKSNSSNSEVSAAKQKEAELARKRKFEQNLYYLRHRNWEFSDYGPRGNVIRFYYRRIYYDDGQMVNGLIVDLNGNIRKDYVRYGPHGDRSGSYPVLDYYSVPKVIRNAAMKSLE